MATLEFKFYSFSHLDINECSGSHACSQICSNTVGSYTCSCRPGYTSEGTQCSGE